MLITRQRYTADNNTKPYASDGQDYDGEHGSVNKDSKVIDDFGDEWQRYGYVDFDRAALENNFAQYFDIFPWHQISENSEGFDMGCGSGRWAQFVAPRVGRLNCIEPSQAIEVAKRNLAEHNNVSFYKETTEECSIEPASQDFGYCLGVLHHIPNTEAALGDCEKLLKSGAPLLLYLYYNFENRPLWFRALWRISDVMRQVICRLPASTKTIVCELIALTVYWPLARLALLARKILNNANMPLVDYADKPYYQMRNDALDRFGTRIEQRFSKTEIKGMLTRCGFVEIRFSDQRPFLVLCCH
uniref:2 polyprenyl 3 methyl 5 hydroxy 6 metoxy 1 4 benz oquinol methylase n=1 Tax=uncultured organism MedDCM-OCT-S12-C71 TaxID=743666 RepID=D6PLL4_9ZZZZ|nr:2 polyprenyl 3 methyl 5 hydroxy 6 metoxy 1 4 benz oquinol methylase [uncultured organism MedDCM-OCT-S12-C71]